MCVCACVCVCVSARHFVTRNGVHSSQGAEESQGQTDDEVEVVQSSATVSSNVSLDSFCLSLFLSGIVRCSCLYLSLNLESHSSPLDFVLPNLILCYR